MLSEKEQLKKLHILPVSSSSESSENIEDDNPIPCTDRAPVALFSISLPRQSVIRSTSNLSFDSTESDIQNEINAVQPPHLAMAPTLDVAMDSTDEPVIEGVIVRPDERSKKRNRSFFFMIAFVTLVVTLIVAVIIFSWWYHTT